MRSLCFFTAIAILATASPNHSRAWEAATTHAGLTEQAAMGSRLHQRLRNQFGIERGLFAALTVPPADAPELFKVLRTLNPTHGYVPDARGRLLAIGWLAAGSVVADMPPAHAVHHFFDPQSKKGLSDDALGSAGEGVRHRIGTRRAGERLIRNGMSAIEWITHPENPMNVDGFIEQYVKAVTTGTPAERARHTAGALLAAGALLHVLQDMGSPSHVRNDLGAHVQVIGNDNFDVGSRFERLAALAYGRLGVPAVAQAAEASSLQAFFSTDKHEGLADRTAQLWFSANTVPGDIRLRPGTGTSALKEPLAASLKRPYPAPTVHIDLDTARAPDGVRLVDDRGVCVANYRVLDNMLSWQIDDLCAAEQIAVILPEVGAYSAGMLDFLFRGVIEIQVQNKQVVATAAGADFGAGTVEVFWDDARGVRQKIGETTTLEKADTGQSIVGLNKTPKGARALAVVYKGVDQAGQPLVAAGYLRLGKAKRKPTR